MTLGEMLRVSIAMPLLLVLSVLVVAQALERAYVFWFSYRLPTNLWERIRERLYQGDVTGAAGLCRLGSGTVEQAFERLLTMPNQDTEKLIEAFQYYRQKLSMDLSRRIGLFGTCSFIAPLIGLMGTVLGIMRAFHDLSVAGAGGPTVVAAGISEALVTTAAGIGLAVLSAMLYNYFTLAARHRLNMVDLWVFEVANLLSQRRESEPPATGKLVKL
jgi:biopolymer transport protein ExbB